MTAVTSPHAQPHPASAPAPAPKASRSVWSQLSTGEQAALQPLQPVWVQLSPAQRRTWRAIARNFNRLPLTEQRTLHERMQEWAALKPKARARARLNFSQMQALASAQERKQMWQAYLALSEAERQALADSAPPPPRGTALSIRPTDKDKLAPIPPSALQQGTGRARIAVSTGSAAHESPNLAAPATFNERPTAQESQHNAKPLLPLTPPDVGAAPLEQNNERGAHGASPMGTTEAGPTPTGP